jgi:signal transduction histidine kinase
VDWLASELTKHHGISVEMAVNGEEKALSKQTELMLFRIVQEALNNVWKHSEATRVTVSFEYSDSTVKVTIRDNGKGFNIPPRVGDLAVAGKLGLTGVQERAQLLGGVLNIKSQPGKGTELSVEVKIRSV